MAAAALERSAYALMKAIAHILPWQGVGGTEHATLRVARAVAGRYSSVFFCPSGAPEVTAFFHNAGQTTVPYQQVEPSYRSPWSYLHASWQLAREFRRRRIDIVHCSDWGAVQYAALAAKLARCRLVTHVRNRNESIPRRDWRPLRFVDRFVFVSRHTAAGFGYPHEPGRAVVLYDGIAPSIEAATAEEVRTRFGLPPASRLIGMAARVAEQKDFTTLIAAAALLKDRYPEIRIVILGDHERHPTHREHYRGVKAELEKYGVESLFHFAGFCEDVQRLLGGLEIFALSTHWEGLPLVILEAMAQALPVVATAVDGIPEVVDNEVSGYLVPHADAPALATALDKMLACPEAARRMGQAGRQRVIDQFSLDQFSKNLHALYASLSTDTPA